MKVCKIHGELIGDALTKYNVCRLCENERVRQWKLKNKQKIKEYGKAYHINNREKRIQNAKKSPKEIKKRNAKNYFNRNKEKLGDSYIKRLLVNNSNGLSMKNIPQEMIDLKRATLLIRKIIKDSKNE